VSETPIADRRFLPTATGDRRFLPSVALVLGVIVTVALGYWGWYRARAGLPHGGEFLHRIYLTLQLFVLHPQDLPRHGWPWQLEVARFTAAAVVATATVTVLVSVFRRPLDELRLRALARHVIVCGGGVHGHRLAWKHAEGGGLQISLVSESRATNVVGLAANNAKTVVINDQPAATHSVPVVHNVYAFTDSAARSVPGASADGATSTVEVAR